jgi:hypothetical protein
MSEDYIPSDEDILRARIRSVGIDSVTVNLDGTCVRIYDVGGQRNERSKWASLFGDVRGVVFCVSFADFDKPMFQALPNRELRIRDALELFSIVIRQEHFTGAPVFLLCNKFDVFIEKVRDTDCFVRAFPDYQGDRHDVDECADFLIGKFLSAADREAGRRIHCFRQDALNGDNVVANVTDICRCIHDIDVTKQ